MRPSGLVAVALGLLAFPASCVARGGGGHGRKERREPTCELSVDDATPTCYGICTGGGNAGKGPCGGNGKSRECCVEPHYDGLKLPSTGEKACVCPMAACTAAQNPCAVAPPPPPPPALECFVAGSEYTEARCCAGPGGDASCWGGEFQFETCCPQPSCDDLEAQTNAVQAACCTSKSDDCSSGHPTSCDNRCANVLLPFIDNCVSPQLSRADAAQFDDVIALCRANK